MNKSQSSTIVLATRNQHKISEIKSILGSSFNFRTLGDYVSVEVKEAGRTLLDNSLAKAEFTFKISNQPSLADDSGLFVDALDGEPGVLSARYGKNDEKRIARLLHALGEHKNRRAQFKAIFVFYYGINTYKSFSGVCTGIIADEPRGTCGFGYDPIFIPDGYTQTFAELGQEIKDQISHRTQALKKFKDFFKNSFS